MCPSQAVHMFPNQKLYFNRDIKMKIRKRRESSSQETKWSIRELGMSCKSPSEQQKGPTHKNLKATMSTTKHTACGRWSTTTTDNQDATLPDSLNTFYTRFDRLNTDTPSKAWRDLTNTAFQVTHTGPESSEQGESPQSSPPRALKACGE